MTTLLVKHIKNKMAKGYSRIIIICGGQRTGKTALALRLAYEVDPTFNTEEQMFFEITKFANAINKFNNKAIILDEVGISLDPLEYYSVAQKVYSHLIATQMYKTLCIFLIYPFASDIGKRHNKNANAVVEVFGRGCFKTYATQSWYADLSQKPPRLRHIETVLGVPLAPDHIWLPYKEKGEAIYKQSILDMQTELLNKKNTLKKPLTKLKPIPLQ